MKRKQTITLISVVVLSIALFLLVCWFLTQSSLGLGLAERHIPLPSKIIAKNLYSDDRDLVMTSLGILEKRCDPVGREQATKLLDSEDDYIWFNTAQYLGSIRDPVSIPYLIKGLRHPARRSYDTVEAHLRALTGKDFGKNQKEWLSWWTEQYPESNFNFSYPKIQKQTLELDDRYQYLINSVIDPVRVGHVGSQIRLIGVKLKRDVSQEEAITLLKTLVLLQHVQLEFDDGPKLDEEGARRAFVYWTRSVDSGLLLRLGRKGLPPVPFEEKTLINAYLLTSGLYEIDLDSVSNEEMKALLSNAIANQ